MSAYDNSPFNLSIFRDCDTVAVIEVFSDASDMAGYTAVGSLLFRKKHIKPFEKEWAAMLRRFSISHFHMTDCNSSRGEFDGWCFERRDACARVAIGLLVKYPLKGIAFTVRNQDFAEVITDRGIMPNPVTLGAWATLFDIRHWAEEHDPSARISYVFEAGDAEQPSINNLFNSIAEDPQRKANARYRNHVFVPKLASYPTQAADILAWHAARNAKRRVEGKPMRGDFAAIVRQIKVSDGHHDRAWLERLIQIAKKNAGNHGNELSGAAFLQNRFNAPQMRSRWIEIMQRDD